MLFPSHCIRCFTDSNHFPRLKFEPDAISSIHPDVGEGQLCKNVLPVRGRDGLFSPRYQYSVQSSQVRFSFQVNEFH